MRILKNTDQPDFSVYRKLDSYFDTALVWHQYGHWCRPTKYNQSYRPAWYTPEFVREAHKFAHTLVAPDTRLWYTTYANGENFSGKTAGGKWATYDVANKILYWCNAVCGCQSERAAENYILNRHVDYKRLYEGVINCLLVYKETGIACLPDWNTNESDSYGYNENGENRVPRAREVLKKEGKVI